MTTTIARAPTAGPHVAEFIETFARHSKGEWAGQTIELRPWQRDLLDGIFKLRPNGMRQHRIAYVGMARKNGKSTLCAALALYGLIADGEPGAEVYSCAGDRKQAEIVFSEAKRMVQADPDLSEIVRVQRYHLEVPSTGAIYRVLSADAALQQGLNPSFVVFDEVHVQPTDDLWTAMTLGSGTRRQPLIIGITTAGWNDESLAYRLYDYGKKIETHQVEDPTFFFRWWEPRSSSDDHRDPKTWAEANPAFGDFLKIEDFETTVGTTPESEFRRFRCNQWTQTEDIWLPVGAWDACKAPEFELDPRLPLYVGIDVALVHDTSAVVCAQVVDGRTVVRARVWANPYLDIDPRHNEWRFNPFEIEEHLKDLYKRFPVAAAEIDGRLMPGPEFDYDPNYFPRSAQVLEGDGLTMVEFPQAPSRMVPASQQFYQLICEGKIAHDGDPILTKHILNVIAQQGPRGWTMSKPKGSRRKIDAAIAAAIAVYRAQTLAPAESVYESRGLVVL